MRRSAGDQYYVCEPHGEICNNHIGLGEETINCKFIVTLINTNYVTQNYLERSLDWTNKELRTQMKSLDRNCILLSILNIWLFVDALIKTW